VFQRTTALALCLQSLDRSHIDRVIIADNGHVEDRKNLYDAEWSFDLTVLDLGYDVGIGRCRAAIADELREEYLLVMDNDMTVPLGQQDIDRLVRVLASQPELGGVSGVLIEGNRLRSGCANFHERTLFTGSKVLVQDVKTPPQVAWTDDRVPFVKFDKIPQCAVLKRECLLDYAWDPQFRVAEHEDFFLGHYHLTEWEFAVTPTVIFDHRKEIDPRYRHEIRSGSSRSAALQRSVAELYEQKWGYDALVFGKTPHWIDSSRPSRTEALYRSLQFGAVADIMYMLRRAIK
jgi:hypothetical protein